MTLSGNFFALILGLISPGLDNSLPVPVTKPAAYGPVPTQEDTVPEQSAAIPVCVLALQGSNDPVRASIDAPPTGFEGSARLQLSGQGFMHDDQRPIRMEGSASMSLRVPSVPLPADLQGELTILNSMGETVCTDRL